MQKLVIKIKRKAKESVATEQAKESVATEQAKESVATEAKESAFEIRDNLSEWKITPMDETMESKLLNNQDAVGHMVIKIKRKKTPKPETPEKSFSNNSESDISEITIVPPPPEEEHSSPRISQIATEGSSLNAQRCKTQKKKRTMTAVEKNKLWDIFDNDKTELEDPECLYTASLPTNPTPEQDLCILCESTMMIMDIGYPTCTNKACGWICRDTLDYSPEWRFYGAEDKNANDPTRCGNPINPLLVESSFGCKVLCNNKSSYEMKKIRKWTEWQSMPHKEKSLYDEFQFITAMAQNAGIPKIFIDYAMIIHKDISEQKMFRGMNRDGIKAASIYISCRLNGCPRTAYEIAEVFKLDKTSTTNGCSMAVNILYNIERNVDPELKTDLCTTLPSAFIDRYCSRLNYTNELTMVAKFVAKKVEQNNIITDNIPHAIACGILYFVAHNCNLSISKTDIKQVCGVSEVTINKCFKKLESFKTKLIPTCILDKYSE
jgi:transcription initiation factor TFIIB